MKRKIFKRTIIITAITMAVLLSPIFVYFLYSGGSILPFSDQDKQALSYLKERYGKEFTVIRDGGGDSLGSSVTYFKRLAPVSDTSMEFVVQRCLARCGAKESTEFSDSYPLAVWSKQETKALQSDPESMNIPLNAKVTAQLYGRRFKKSETWMLANTDTGVVSFRDLPEARRVVGYTLYITLQDRNPAPTPEDFLSFAKTLVAIRTKMDEANLSFDQFTAKIAPRELADDSGWRFYNYSYSSPGFKNDTQSAEEIAGQFKKNTFSDMELYKQIKTDR